MRENWDLKTYCEVLGVSENSPQYEIHAAYKRAKELYSPSNPDVQKSFSTEELNALETLVEEAFAILGNHSLRSIYMRKNEARNVKPLLQNNIQNFIAEKPAPTNSNDIKTKEQHNVSVYNGREIARIREEKGISIQQMTELTKIKSTYLTALESDEFSVLPAPVYTRGFLIQIAKVLSLPPNKVASSYLALYNKQDEGN